MQFAAIALGLLVSAAPVLAETFDYTFDRFEIDGNLNGPLDGTPDLVEEFDDGVLAPWYIRRGTGTESGGFAHVQTPGLRITLPGIFPVAFEASAIGTNNVLHLGAGDAVLRVVLPQQAIGANDSVSFDLATIEGQALYYAGIVLTNYNSTIANSFTPLYPVGLAATAHLERLSFTNEALAAQHHAIAPSSVTGPIVLELRYDDTAQEVTPAVSVDGGATYAAVFDPLEVESDFPDIVVQTAVAALEGACPAGLSIRRASISRLQKGPGAQRIKLRLAFNASLVEHGFNPIRLVVTDEGAGSAVVYDVTVPDRVITFQQPCGPDDEWGRKGYVNQSNAFPPACTPGSAQGLRTFRPRRRGGDFEVQVEVRDMTLPPITGPLRVAVYNGTGPANECDGWIGDGACRVGHSTAVCED